MHPILHQETLALNGLSSFNSQLHNQSYYLSLLLDQTISTITTKAEIKPPIANMKGKTKDFKQMLQYTVFYFSFLF